MNNPSGTESARGSSAPLCAGLPPADTRLKVLLADDYPLLRFATRTLIEREKDLLVCGTASNPADTLEAIARWKPDVVVTAFSLRSTATFELIREMRSRHARTPILVISYKDDPILAKRISRSGATGMMARADAAECVVEAVRRVAQGLPYVSAKTSTALASQMFDPVTNAHSTQQLSFTHREQEILELIGGGLTPREIAEALRLSIKTVESHRENIKQKLGIRTAAKLAPYAFQWLQNRRQP